MGKTRAKSRPAEAGAGAEPAGVRCAGVLHLLRARRAQHLPHRPGIHFLSSPVHTREFRLISRANAALLLRGLCPALESGILPTFKWFGTSICPGSIA